VSAHKQIKLKLNYDVLTWFWLVANPV